MPYDVIIVTNFKKQCFNWKLKAKGTAIGTTELVIVSHGDGWWMVGASFFTVREKSNR